MTLLELETNNIKDSIDFKSKDTLFFTIENLVEKGIKQISKILWKTSTREQALEILCFKEQHWIADSKEAIKKRKIIKSKARIIPIHRILPSRI